MRSLTGGTAFGAKIANTIWLAAGRGAAQRFHRALSTPSETQTTLLRRQLQRHADSEFGQQHHFASISSYAEFARSVPLCQYDDVAPLVDRIRRGARGVLCSDAVTHLAPTSGSTNARKLIPFTTELTRQFDAAVAPWMFDLVRQRPAMRGGAAYWSISPLASELSSPDGSPGKSTVPIGLTDDAQYLGNTKAWLVRQLLAVPSAARHVSDESAFWALTLLALLRRADLRLISVWHPSFLELLVGHGEQFWPELLEAVRSGHNPWAAALPAGHRDRWQTRPDRRRADALRAIGPANWARWWPDLQVVSCWGEQAAEPGWRRLSKHLSEHLPGVLVQAKGLLATEGVVTVPVAGVLPLALTSHVFEFIDEKTGEILRPHELQQGHHYQVVLTNGAGLWRYQLRDVVECTGWLARTPTLRFLGRLDQVSDMRGEKLAEPFVAECLRRLWPDGHRPAVVVLRAVDAGVVGRYELLISDQTGMAAIAAQLDQTLQANPHYALARRLGQLAAVRAVAVEPDFLTASLQSAPRRGTIGDIKPPTLIRA